MKRFGIDAAAYDDRLFVVTGDGDQPCLFDHESTKADKIDPDVVAFFDGFDRVSGDHLIAFAWAMADNLEKLGS